MTIQDLVFAGIAAVTLIGGFLAVWPKNVFHNALALILSLFGMAALFIYLNAEFLAVIQVIIYIGAISIAIIFAIMLSRPWSHRQAPRSPMKLGRAIVSAALLFAGLVSLLRKTAWLLADTSGDYSIRAIGKSLLTVYALPFEVISLVLLISIIGALMISGDSSDTGKTT